MYVRRCPQLLYKTEITVDRPRPTQNCSKAHNWAAAHSLPTTALHDFSWGVALKVNCIVLNSLFRRWFVVVD